MVTAAATAGRTLSLVGREAERARIDAFAAALPGGAGALIVRGEAGIGKTALWRYGVERCRRDGCRVLVARAAEEEMSLALAGLVDLFERTDVEPVALDAESNPFATGRAVLSVLRGLAESGPTVLAIDDLQWLDPASARALRYALRRLDAEPVGVLATARPDARPGDPLAASDALPPGRAETIELGPLSLGALRRVLGGTVATISRPTLRRIHEVSGGNPLYAIELARGLAADERAYRSGGGLPLPDSLQAAIARRLDTVPSELVDLLETTSALAATSVPELRELLAGADVDALLALAAQQGLLVVDEDLGVRFSHPLLGSAVYGRMSPLARRALHAHLAGLADDPDVRARHLALSTDEPSDEIAALLEAAAGRARRRGASELAAEYAGHSVRLTRPAETDALRRRTLGEIDGFAAAGEVSRALELADGLVATLPPGPGRAEALVQRADLEDDDRATAESLLLGALEEAGDDERLRGRVLDHLAQLRRLRIGDVPGAIESAREALALAERVGDARLEVHAAAYLAHLEMLAGQPRPELMERAVALEDDCGGVLLSPGPRALLAKHLLWAGDIASARELLETVNATLVRAGIEIQRPQHFYDLTLVECAAGNLATADELARRGVEAARDAENTYAERELLHPLALVHLWLGRAEEARGTAARLREEAERHGVRPLLARELSMLGLLALSEGDTQTAARSLAEAAALLEEMGFAHPAAFPVLPDAVEALAAVGETAAAEELLARLERRAREVDSAWAAAAALRARGFLLLSGGAADDAASALEEAATALDALGYRTDAARAVLGHGRALLRGGHRGRAADTLADARGRFAGLGAPLWEARAVEELERAAPGRSAGELTPAEQRVVALVAQGRKNREIAQTLYMSVASVEAHLTRIYRKLEIRSRSELTRLVAEGSLEVPEGDA